MQTRSRAQDTWEGVGAARKTSRGAIVSTFQPSVVNLVEQAVVASRHNAGPILVVDDDPAIRATVAEILALEGYPIETAADGLEALDAITRQRPSLVLLDMRMPMLDGWGVARRLREEEIRLPIIVMTAAQNARRWAEEIGADSYISKPFELVDLLETVERFVGPPPHSA
jgi:CheY-like chemotaxis protein